MSKFLTSGLILFFVVVDSFAQPFTPTSFLQKMPEPPKSVEEALKRCPQESDTVAANALRRVEEMERAQLVLLDRDSLAASKRPDLALNKEVQKIQNEIERQKRALQTSLDSLTSPAAQQLLDEIRVIGEELDKQIMNCPKVGERQIFDSVCVESVEGAARTRRIAASQKFLENVGGRWKSIFTRTKETIVAQDHQLQKFYDGVKKPDHRIQLSRIYSDLWEMVKNLLKSVDEITRLATRFSRS